MLEGEWRDSIGGEGGQAWLPTLRLTEAWLKEGLILTPIDCGSESLPPENSGRGRFGCMFSALFNHQRQKGVLPCHRANFPGSSYWDAQILAVPGKMPQMLRALLSLSLLTSHSSNLGSLPIPLLLSRPVLSKMLATVTCAPEMEIYCECKIHPAFQNRVLKKM